MLLVAGVLLLQCCTTVTRRRAVPAELQADSEVAGFPAGMRYFPRDAHDVELFQKDFVESWARERVYLGMPPPAPLPATAYLTISGGGDDGAFGAGLLNGWTKAGTRPEFKLVTGVSTGALIAPFAFLGPAYDEQLKALYTGVSIKDIAEWRTLLSVWYGDALFDTTPLKGLVKKYVTQEMLDAIAAEHDKGRILLVGTTNLDALRPVIWNITKIAATHRPEALALIRKILMASAAIPGTFPPVMIEARAGGRTYEEMHVDGGAANQVFVYPIAADLARLSSENDADRVRKLYVIRNARLDPEWSEVERRTLSIARSAITCLIQYQGIGDLYRIFTIARRDHIDFNLAYIPATFDAPHAADFDQAYMRSLFEVGYRTATEDQEWFKHPPVLVSGEGE